MLQKKLLKKGKIILEIAIFAPFSTTIK